MANYTLDVQPRAVTGKKVSQLRTQKIVPAIVYGGTLSAPMAIQIPYRALELMLLKAGGTNLITLVHPDGSYDVLAREVQRDVLRGTITHVDFLAVDATKLITANIPVSFVNESPGVAARYGVLVNGLQIITIQALPADLVNHLDMDISVIRRPGDAVFVRDLIVPPNVRVLNDPDEMIVNLTAVRGSLTVDEEEAPAPSEPELIGRGKKDDDFED